MIIEQALESIKDFSRLKKIIFIGAPHTDRVTNLPVHVRVFNIYSEKDRMLDLACKVYARDSNNKQLANAQNIIINISSHSDFNRNIEVDYEGRKIKLYELYKKLILS